MSSHHLAAALSGKVLGQTEAAMALILEGSVFGKHERRAWRTLRALYSVSEDQAFSQKSKIGSTSSSQSFETQI